MKSRHLAGLAAFAAAAGLALGTPDAAAEDDFQYWSWLSLYAVRSPAFDLYTYGQVRFVNDLADDGLYHVSERFVLHWAEGLDLGTNYSYISSVTTDAAGREEFKDQHRWELEANPSWKPAEWIRVKSRNRLELRWIEDQGDKPRFRQRWEIQLPVKDARPLDYFFANNEFFFNFEGEAYNENRLVPLGVNLRLRENASLQVFYMVQSRKGSRDWSANEVLGTHVVLTF
jgi:hypothetical protein